MFKFLAILFVISIFIPVEFYYLAGGLRLEAYRIVLALVLIVSLFNIKSLVERADLVDILLLGFVVLATISFMANHGLKEGIEKAGIFSIEVLGAFYLARNFITTPKRYFKINMAFIGLLTLAVGFSFYESFAHHRILHEYATKLTGHQSLDPTLYTHYYIRFDILRATNLFVHPILYGALTAIFFPFVILLLFFSFKTRYLIATLALLSSMLLTMSSAPMLSAVFQGMVATLSRYWEGSKRFWLSGLFFVMSGAFLVNLISNRGFFALLVSHLTFNPATGYYRMFQWQYAMDDVLDNPLLGIGISEWSRPSWLNYSIDSFWLLITMQHGIPAGFLLLFCCLYIVFHVLNNLHKQHEYYRWMANAWVLSFMSLILIGFTVDYFGKLQPMFFFVLGSIAWVSYPQLNKHMRVLVWIKERKERVRR
ncbi:MAG: O-antigen ligase family protein [Thiotrichaceae bacterium]|nr:O-antigen ligase family protein [Thiotrichaceae bacterium]